MAEGKQPKPDAPTILQPVGPAADPATVAESRLARLNPLRWLQRDTPAALLARGQQLIDRRSFHQAQSVFQEVLRRDETSTAALRGLATALMLQGGRSNLLAAQAHFQEVARQDPTDVPVCVALAGIYEKLGHAEEADRERRKGAILKRLQQEPDNAAANNNLGILLVQQRLWEPAIAAFRKAVEKNPKLDVGWRNLAAACYHQAQAEPEEGARAPHIAAGLQAIEQAMALNPSLPSLLTLALLKSLSGDTQAAAEVLAQAQAQAPQNRDVYAVMRTVLERAGMFDEALKANEIYAEMLLE